jgi:hypothetical protein
MNKNETISFWKKQLETARTSKAIGRQIIAQATQIESEAKSALDTLEANSRRTRKGEILPEALQLKLTASLTQ